MILAPGCLRETVEQMSIPVLLNLCEVQQSAEITIYSYGITDEIF